MSECPCGEGAYQFSIRVLWMSFTGLYGQGRESEEHAETTHPAGRLDPATVVCCGCGRRYEMHAARTGNLPQPKAKP